jgi:hypothetical protein
MPTEERFVGLESSQVMAGKKQLLYSEMELLTILQKYKRYKKLRKEELATKNLLKKVITDIKNEMEILIQYMPQIKIRNSDTESMNENTTKRDSLEEEIQEIRRRIFSLSKA